MKIPNLGLVLVLAIGLAGASAVAALGHQVPVELWAIDGVLAGAVAGVTVPQGAPSPAAPPTASGAAPAPAAPLSPLHVGEQLPAGPAPTTVHTAP
jgi:hypothetical protein